MASIPLLSTLMSVASTSLKHIQAVLQQTKQHGSIARGIAAAQVNPITLIDSTLKYDERLSDSLHVFVNMYAAIYLQSVALSNTTVGGTQIIKRLEKLNPTISTTGLGLEDIYEDLPDDPPGIVSQILPEGEVFDLPSMESLKLPLPMFSMESSQGATDKTHPTDQRTKPIYPGERGSKEVLASGKINEALKDVPELAVGKMFSVELRSDGETHSIPVSIRLATTIASQASLIKAMQNRFSGVETALERKVRYKSGSITGFMDLLLCRDLVREHYKNLIADKDGVYAKLSPEKSKSYIKALLTGEVSVAQASNILLISSDTAARVEGLTGGKFHNKNFRNRMLLATGIMLLGIIDAMDDSITIYVDNLDSAQLVSGRNLSRVSKKDGPDVNEVLRMLVEGRGSLLR